jgi:FAD:protein FMN transferase
MTKKSLSRRQFLQIVAVGGIAGLTTKFSLDTLSQEQIVSETRLLMGTVVNLKVVGADPKSAQAAIRAGLDRMAQLESVFSRFQPDSQLSQLNRAGFLMNADPALIEVVSESQKFSRLSNGAFDITVKPLLDLYQQAKDYDSALPCEIQLKMVRQKVGFDKIQVSGQDIKFSTAGMEITVDGIAKGYIVDAGVATLREFGFSNVMVEAGGDLLASGQKSTQSPWTIGINSPREADKLISKIDITNKAVATSGDYMQPFTDDLAQHHILDPRSGYSAPELASATVVAPAVMLADALVTTLMVLGPIPGQEFLQNFPGCAGYLVSKDLEIIQTPDFLKISGNS